MTHPPSDRLSFVRRRSAVAALPILLVVLFSAPSGATPSDTLAFGPSGLDGGGFINVIAADPAGTGVVIAGGDVSGFHRSVDWGQHWVTSNTGVNRLEELSVAAILFSPTTPGLVYAAVGIRGAGGGLLVSTDDGVSWSLRSSVPQFSGANNNGVGGLPSTHPRSTGDLLASDPSTGMLYAATFSKGVLRSADGGQTWTVLGLAGKHLRGVALDPTNPAILYVGAYNDGVYRTTTAALSGAFVKLAGSPTTPEEFWISGSILYVAGGPAGVFRSADGGVSWEPLGIPSIPTDGPSWMAIGGYHACDRDVLFVGAFNAGANTVMRSLDGGATWSSLAADPSLIHTTVGGADGEQWWLAAQPTMLMGGTYSAATQFLFGPEDAEGPDCVKDRVLVAGRAGIWGSEDAGADWYPLVSGMGVSISRDVTVDPALPGRMYLATADWVFHSSLDGANTVTQAQPPVGTTGADIAVDDSVSPAAVYLATGDPSANTKGRVYSSADITSSGWTDEGLSSKTGNKRPLALVARTVGTQRILIAAVERSGIWRKVGSTWSKVNATAMAGSQPSRGASLEWPAGSSTVYLYDHVTGVWRSNDSGKTWSKIWARPSPDAMTGYLAVDPASPSRLFVSVGGLGVYRLDGATNGSVGSGAIAPASVGGFTHPGAIGFAPTGELYAASLAAPGSPPALLRSDDLGTTWSVVSDAFYAGAAGYVFDLAIGPDGTVYVATNGNGVIVGRPS